MRSVADPDDSEAVGEQLDYAALMNVVQTTIRPEEWNSMGGPCSMAPLPRLESLAINAPPDVHRSLKSFFTDLASVELAVANAKKQKEARQGEVEDATARALEPVEKSLATSLEPIAAGVDLVGSWEVRPGSAAGPAVRYTFIDEKTVTIGSPNATQPTETRYATLPATLILWGAVSPSSVGGMGTGYHAAWTADQDLVLIPHNAPDAFLVAKRIEAEQ